MKKDYFSIIDNSIDCFINNGWADGYADLPSDHNEIISQLYNKISNDKLIECLDLYLQGYELGSFMSEEAVNIYNEDGFLKEDEYDLCTLSHYTEAEQLVLSKKIRSDIHGKKL